jgi:acid phosphatase (class A)
MKMLSIQHNFFAQGRNCQGLFHKVLLLTLSLLFTFPTYAQKKGPFRELTPICGTYKLFASFNAKPKSPNEDIDKLKFPFDQVWADKVLSIKPVYLQNISTDDFKLPDPPANSSDQTRAELNYLLALQHSRGVEEVRASMYISEVKETPSDVGRMIGYWINPQTLPVTDALMENVSKDGNYFLWSLKFKYARVRPYVLEPRLHDLEESRAASYPGGHATFAYINAYIYQELAPEFTDCFIKRAYDMTYSRSVIGVHYPSDSEVSRIFARQFVNMLFENEKFRQDFEGVKKEWAMKATENATAILKKLRE